LLASPEIPAGEVPTEFVAVTATVYTAYLSVPTIAHVVSACDVHVPPPGVAVAVNDLIAPPPSSRGMFQVTTRATAVGFALTLRGALGSVVAIVTGLGVTSTGTEPALPPKLEATTATEYGV
jgi:hypothetical protein